jgi:hypothetical protein
MTSLEYKDQIKLRNKIRSLQRRMIMLAVASMLSVMAMSMHAYVLPIYSPELSIPLGLVSFVFSVYVTYLAVKDDEFRLNGTFDFIFGNVSAKHDLVGDKLDIPFMLSSNVFISVAAIKWCLAVGMHVRITGMGLVDAVVVDVVDSTLSNSAYPCTGNIIIYTRLSESAEVKALNLGPGKFLSELDGMLDQRIAWVVRLATTPDYYWSMRNEFNRFVDLLVTNEYMGVRRYESIRMQ